MNTEHGKIELPKPKYPKYMSAWISLDGISTCVMLGNSIPFPGGHVYYRFIGYKGLREETFIYPTLEELEKLPRNLREPVKAKKQKPCNT